MKRYTELKKSVVSMGVLVVMLGVACSASADVAFPNTFTNGTPAVAEQVNQNFQAINTRQTATFARMAGTYTFTFVGGFGTGNINVVVPYVDSVGQPPSMVDRTAYSNPVIFYYVTSFMGTLTLTSGGVATISANGYDDNDGAQSFSGSGAYTVNSNGTGVITVPMGTNTLNLNFAASRDLNTIIWQTSGQATTGIALRN